mgnify:CR=1 FL=1
MNTKVKTINVSSILARHEEKLSSIPESSERKRTSGYWFLMSQLNAIHHQINTLRNQSASLVAELGEIKSLPVIDRDMEQFDSIEQLNGYYLCINKVNIDTFNSLKELMKSEFDVDFIGKTKKKTSYSKPNEKIDFDKVYKTL